MDRLQPIHKKTSTCAKSVPSASVLRVARGDDVIIPNVTLSLSFFKILFYVATICYQFYASLSIYESNDIKGMLLQYSIYIVN